jgi:hypothetical protein
VAKRCGEAVALFTSDDVCVKCVKSVKEKGKRGRVYVNIVPQAADKLLLFTSRLMRRNREEPSLNSLGLKNCFEKTRLCHRPHGTSAQHTGIW